MLKRFLRQFRYGQKGFTLIELLVVVAILGALAAVCVPNIGKFIGKGKTEAYETELHNLQVAVMAMLFEATSQKLNCGLAGYNGISDMSQVQATGDGNHDGTDETLYLSDYLIPLNVDLSVRSGCTYDFTEDGTITQTLPP
jgi:prepilin-type N-terminal cleavage/methylation domain-containing protein